MASSAGLPPLALSGGPNPTGRPPHRSHHPHPGPPGPGCAMVESVDDAEGLYVAVERCPLCSTSRRRLTCARCVQAGDFVYFDGRNCERFVFGFWSSILAEVRCVRERCSQDETCFCPRRHRRRTKMRRVLGGGIEMIFIHIF